MMLGDVIGKPGRRAVNELLPSLRQQYGLDLVIANGENAAGGLGLTSTTAKELFNAGVDVFRAMEKLLAELNPRPSVIIVDFHAEATSEKVAMGRYLDGRVSAVLGTHTHVGTIDARVLPQGTAYVTDIGMTGPIDSVIGNDTEAVIQRFLTSMPYHLSVGKGKTMFNAVLVRVDDDSGRGISIDRIYKEVG